MDEDTTGEVQNRIAPCPECRQGVMHLRHLTYFTWLNYDLITVPNFPSWVCDLCGRREYDPKAITWLNTLLNHESGRPVSRRRIVPPGTDQLQP